MTLCNRNLTRRPGPCQRGTHARSIGRGILQKPTLDLLENDELQLVATISFSCRGLWLGKNKSPRHKNRAVATPLPRQI
jgi:hypothetical protein